MMAHTCGAGPGEEVRRNQSLKAILATEQNCLKNLKVRLFMKFVPVQIVFKCMYQKLFKLWILFVYFLVLFTFIEYEGARGPAWMSGEK